MDFFSAMLQKKRMELVRAKVHIQSIEAPPTKTQIIQSQCPNARHSRTTPEALRLHLDVSEPLWQHKENMHNKKLVVLLLWLIGVQ